MHTQFLLLLLLLSQILSTTSLPSLPPAEVFDGALEVAMDTMKNDSFPRFLRSKWFLAYQTKAIELHAKLHMAGLD